MIFQGFEGAPKAPLQMAARSAAPRRRRREAPPRPTAREALRAGVLQSTREQQHGTGKQETDKLLLTGFVCAKHGLSYIILPYFTVFL